MPSTYAHYRFGNEVLKHLPENERIIINKNIDLYLIGLHGPDILFYYKPLKRNKINNIGYELHEKQARFFFENAKKIIRRSYGRDRNAALAYIYGFICHYALDSGCHGYIDKKIKQSGLSHTEIEAEFDSMLMRIDGYVPEKHNLTKHIIPSDKNAMTISLFFSGVTVNKIRTALKSMIFYNWLLLDTGLFKRKIVSFVLKMSGNYKEMHGLMINNKMNVECKDSNIKLTKLYKERIIYARDLICEYKQSLKNNTKLSDKYNHTFGAEN